MGAQTLLMRMSNSYCRLSRLSIEWIRFTRFDYHPYWSGEPIQMHSQTKMWSRTGRISLRFSWSSCSLISLISTSKRTSYSPSRMTTVHFTVYFCWVADEDFLIELVKDPLGQQHHWCQNSKDHFSPWWPKIFGMVSQPFFEEARCLSDLSIQPKDGKVAFISEAYNFTKNLKISENGALQGG